MASIGSTIPAVCYDDCNTAYILAQSAGKSGELCAAGSPFQEAYAVCAACIDDNTNATKTIIKDYVDPDFQPFIDFCSGYTLESTTSANIVTSVVTVTPTGSGRQTSVVLVTRTASTSATAASTTASDDEEFVTITLASYTVTVAATAVIKLLPTSGVEAETLSSPPNSTSSAEVESSSTASPSPRKSKAWIVGPIVGGIVVLLLVLGIGVYWHRRRQRQKGTHPGGGDAEQLGKAQLHGDCLPRIDHELEGSTPKARREISELPANEPVGKELSGESRTEKAPT
ncbi:Fc.00g061440.m01.CDS01 [Cosmosporella sp. VM-42]